MTAPTPSQNNGDPSYPRSGPYNPSPTAEITALAAHLRRIVDRVDDLDTRCNQLTDHLTATVLPRLADMAADTAAQLAEHSDQVQNLLDTLTARRAADPLDWPAATVEEATAAWNTLADWIADTLVPWYEITREQLPDCWALHRPVVTQLSWLHHTYLAAHQPGAGPRPTAEWHTRWLPAAISSISAAIPRRGIRTCGPGRHLTNPSDSVRDHPRQSSGPPLPNMPAPAPGSQLAERPNWQHFYSEAFASDITRRKSSGLGLSD